LKKNASSSNVVHHHVTTDYLALGEYHEVPLYLYLRDQNILLTADGGTHFRTLNTAIQQGLVKEPSPYAIETG
jgi:hypothetical protein